jgi:hypothetical protein
MKKTTIMRKKSRSRMPNFGSPKLDLIQRIKSRKFSLSFERF